jgi:anti-anti-sigma factor
LVRVRSLDQDGPDPIPLADELWLLMERHFAHRLVLELDQVPTLSRHVLGELVRLHQRICERGGVMRLCGLSPRNQRVLRTCRLDDRLTPFESREDAVMSSGIFRRPR